MNPKLTFMDLWEYIHSQGTNIYQYIGIGDSEVRVRLFEELSLIYGVEYDYIYYLWLSKISN
jgi:hypothetical protein